MDESLQSFSPTYNQPGLSRTILAKPLGSTSSGLTLVLPSLKTLKAANGVKNSKSRAGSIPLSAIQDGDVQEKKIPRPLKLKPLKEVLTKLIGQIKRKDDYAFFLTPVDTTQVPGYTDVIKRPMDLGTMTNKVNRGKYRSLEDFASDLRLVTTNAKIFNPPGSLYYTEADRIEAWGLEHIAKAAPTVIQYETDWNIDIEKDEEEPSLNVDIDDDDNVGTLMDTEPLSSKDRSVSVSSQAPPVSNKRGPRGPYKKSATAGAAAFSESLDADGGLPGSKDGLGAFPPGSDWAKTTLALKLKGKRYRTKKERLRFEKEGPPYLPDGSLDYTEMEDPFTVLSSLVPDQPTRPYLTPLYPPLSLPAQQPQWPPQSQPQSDQSTPQPQQPPHSTPFPTAITLPINRPPPELRPLTASVTTKRRHWSVLRNVATRYKGKEKEDDIEAPEAPPWQMPREAHATDFGSFALLAGELAEEMKRRGITGGSVKEEEEEEDVTLDAIRESLDCEAAAAQARTGVGVEVGMPNGMEGYGNGYWTVERAAEAEEYIRDMVYGGVDGLAYVRSLAEFITLDEEQESMFSSSEPGALRMPLAKWVQQNVVDPLTEGRHSILREAAVQMSLQSQSIPSPTSSFLKQEDGSDERNIASQVVASLRVYPAAVIALSALLQIRLHKIDMGALIKAPDELFLSEEEWAGKGLKERRKLRVKTEESDAMEVEEPERTWMDVDAIANGSGQTGSELELEGPEELNEVLEYVAGVIFELDRRIRTDGSATFAQANGKVKQNGPEAEPAEDGSDGKEGDSPTPPSDEEPLVRNLRLNLLALAKRAPLDTIARLPKDLVPEHIRQYVPTLGAST